MNATGMLFWKELFCWANCEPAERINIEDLNRLKALLNRNGLSNSKVFGTFAKKISLSKFLPSYAIFFLIRTSREHKSKLVMVTRHPVTISQIWLWSPDIL